MNVICFALSLFVLETNPVLREKLLESKLEQCRFLCQFEAVNLDGSSAYSSTDALTNGSSARSSGSITNFISPLELRNREIKRQTLLELIELVNSGNKPIPDELYQNFFHMVTKGGCMYFNLSYIYSVKILITYIVIIIYLPHLSICIYPSTNRYSKTCLDLYHRH